jgi:hypothetical protein
MAGVTAKNPLLKERIPAEDARADLCAVDGRLEDLAGRVVGRALE